MQTEKYTLLVSRKLRWLVLAGAVALMGVTMPSCPGQQAMQDQIDSLKTTQIELTKRLQTDEGQMKQLAEAMIQAKTETATMATALGQANASLDQLKLSVQAIDAKLAKPATKAKSTRRR